MTKPKDTPPSGAIAAEYRAIAYDAIALLRTIRTANPKFANARASLEDRMAVNDGHVDVLMKKATPLAGKGLALKMLEAAAELPPSPETPENN